MFTGARSSDSGLSETCLHSSDGRHLQNLREQFGDLGHWYEQPPASFDEKSESVALIELRCFVVLGVHHEGIGRDVVPQHAAKGVEEHELSVPLLLMVSINRQPSHQRRGHDRIAW